MAFEPAFPEFEHLRIFSDVARDNPLLLDLAYYSPAYPAFSVTNNSFLTLGFLVRSLRDKAYVFVPFSTRSLLAVELREISLALWALNTALISYEKQEVKS